VDGSALLDGSVALRLEDSSALPTDGSSADGGLNRFAIGWLVGFADGWLKKSLIFWMTQLRWGVGDAGEGYFVEGWVDDSVIIGRFCNYVYPRVRVHLKCALGFGQS